MKVSYFSCCSGVLAPLLLLSGSVTHAQSVGGKNIGGRLKHLLEATEGRSVTRDLSRSHLTYNSLSRRYELGSGKRNILVDDQNRILVRFVLDSGTTSEAMEERLSRAGGTLVARNQQFHNRVISAYLPIEQVRFSATLPGVKAVHLESPPVLNSGAVTSQGVRALNVDKVLSAGYDGEGVTVGILSDSYNNTAAAGNPDTALYDVQTGDLPGTTAIPGEEGLKFALDNETGTLTDEGRAMAQIVHDMAPKAQLCFATAYVGPASFAEAIVDLRIDPRCGADIIVDDVSYLNEPFFSDGPIAQAVNLVVNSKSLPGKPVSYFTAAGNNLGSGAYASTFRPISPAAAKKLTGMRIDLSSVPKYVPIGGGFHNFNPDPKGRPVLAQKIHVSGSVPLVFQWDDLFDQGAITTDYNLLVFDSDGKYDGELSAVDDNFATDEPLEHVDFDTFSPTAYYLVIARAGGGPLDAPARRLKYINFSNGLGELAGSSLGELSTAIVVGHAAAQGANTVAAYNVNRAPLDPNPPYVPELESYSSAGPAVIAFDSTGKRLVRAEVRSKPNLACVDGVFTSFFGNYVLSSDLYPRFYGTSAAAPCAAAIGAVMMQKAQRPKGPGRLTPGEMSALLKGASTPRTLDPFHLASTADVGTGGIFALNASGASSPIQSPTQFGVTFVAQGKTLYSLTLDIPESGDAVFFLNSRAEDGAPFPLLMGPSSAGVFVRSTKPSSKNAEVMTSTFTLFFGGFTSGKGFQFGLDRIDSTMGIFDDTADRINGTRYVAVFTDGSKAEGTLSEDPHYGYSVYEGHGLIDGKKAVGLVR